jgi:hypothetical protein
LKGARKGGKLQLSRKEYFVDELVNLVAQKVGISPEQAQKAVATVIGFLKERLPDSIAAQLDNVVGAGGSGSGSLGGIAGAAEDALGGMFGKK